jgi:hypothetical protein
MSIAIQMVAVSVALALTLAGPLAPFALAQAQTQPSGRGDLIQEAMKASQPSKDDDEAYDVGAGVMNVFYVPGKVITCVTGGVVSTVLLLATFGTAYKAATGVVQEGCAGKWTLTGSDIKPDEPPSSAFEWEAGLTK